MQAGNIGCLPNRLSHSVFGQKNTKKAFAKFPYNQFRSLEYAEMRPAIQVFFGKSVNVGVVSLGSPWDYFSNELANADHSAISLRPFINTMDRNAVDKALAKTEKYVQGGIIGSEIYASKAVRDETTEKYFMDLTQDAFSKDLVVFKDVIRTSGGEQYRYKSLTEGQFENLISDSFSKIFESPVVKTRDDLKRLIFANGIMAEKITTTVINKTRQIAKSAFCCAFSFEILLLFRTSKNKKVFSISLI